MPSETLFPFLPLCAVVKAPIVTNASVRRAASLRHLLGMVCSTLDVPRAIITSWIAKLGLVVILETMSRAILNASLGIGCSAIWRALSLAEQLIVLMAAAAELFEDLLDLLFAPTSERDGKIRSSHSQVRAIDLALHTLAPLIQRIRDCDLQH